MVQGDLVSEPRLPPQMDGPFQGMLANSRVDTPPGFLSFIQNFFVDDGELRGRPGILSVGSAIGGGNDVQGIYQWQMLDGTQYTCAFANGDLYVLNWATSTWTQYDLSAEGLTVSTTGDINCCTSRGRLIGTDGVNRPFMITGELGGAGESFTELSNAPIANRCGVYYDKVFFWDIPGYENEFQWSDEGDPENGYSGEDQAWEFAQTDAGRILGMAPLNERNVVLKEDSATMLMGSVDENFSTLAVREGLSETEGTVAGGSVVVLDGDVFTICANGPRRIRGGQVYESIHDAGGVDYLRDEWAKVNRSAWSGSLGWVDRQEKHVGWLIPQGSSSDLNTALVFNTKNSSWSVFKFSGYNFTAVGTVEDTSGNEWVFFGDDSGNVYKYRVGFDQWDDNGTATELKATSRPLGTEQPALLKRVTETQFTFQLTGDFQGEIRPVVDGTAGDGKRFAIYDETGKKRYRRGFNHAGYQPGWELYANKTDQTITVTKALTFLSVAGMAEDWNG